MVMMSWLHGLEQLWFLHAHMHICETQYETKSKEIPVWNKYHSQLGNDDK